MASAAAAVDGARANLDVLKAQRDEATRQRAELVTALEKAKRDLSFTRVAAPFDGIVGNKAAEVGNLVQPGTRLMALVPLNAYSHAIVLYREDTKVAVLATWKEGINNIPGEPVMLPGKVSWQPKVTMKDVEALKAVVKKAGGSPTPYQVDLMRYQQWAHINDILEHPLEESYQAKVIENFKWEDWIDPAKTLAQPHVRTDTRLKNYPYRDRPVEAPTQ